jgi:hypothetical protein
LCKVARKRVMNVQLQIILGFEAERLERRLHSVVSIQKVKGKLKYGGAKWGDDSDE